MRKIHGAVFVALDGVIQAPGGPTEDWTGGFQHGGWLPPVADEASFETLDRLFKAPFDLLLGRRTYDIFSSYWPYVEGEAKAMGDLFDRVGKYVVTHQPEPLQWQNSHPLRSMEELAKLKDGEGPDLLIQGSSTLYPQLLDAGLIDRLTMLVYPVVLGSGKRLFGDGTPPRTMKMVEHRVTEAGTVVVSYEPSGPVETGRFGEPVKSEREDERQEKMKRAEGLV